MLAKKLKSKVYLYYIDISWHTSCATFILSNSWSQPKHSLLPSNALSEVITNVTSVLFGAKQRPNNQAKRIARVTLKQGGAQIVAGYTFPVAQNIELFFNAVAISWCA
jgi:hypothetical protein